MSGVVGFVEVSTGGMHVRCAKWVDCGVAFAEENTSPSGGEGGSESAESVSGNGSSSARRCQCTAGSARTGLENASWSSTAWRDTGAGTGRSIAGSVPKLCGERKKNEAVRFCRRLELFVVDVGLLWLRATIR